MKTVILVVLANYVAIGFAHAMFVLVLTKRPRLRLVVTEFLFWPRRTYQGIKVIARDAGKLDI